MQLSDLLQWCGTTLKTGTLRLHRGPIEKQFHFKNGRLLASRSSSPRESLGQFLIRAGHVSEEELFKALIEQDRTDRPLGQILVGEGVILPDALEQLLQLKTAEAIYDCFLWDDGDFSFEDGEARDAVPIALPLDLTGVILEGTRRTDEWRRIHDVFPSRLTTFTLDREAMESCTELEDVDLRLLGLVERGMNLAEIALELHAVEFYAASRLLGLHERGLVRVKDAPEEIDFDEQVTELRGKLEAGAALYNAGEYDRAQNAFASALALDPQNKYARLFTLKIERVLEDLPQARTLPLAAVPRLGIPLEQVAKLELDPQEGFVLSRVNGEWDIESITKICPMGQQEVLIIFKRLLDAGVIEVGR